MKLRLGGEEVGPKCCFVPVFARIQRPAHCGIFETQRLRPAHSRVTQEHSPFAAQGKPFGPQGKPFATQGKQQRLCHSRMEPAQESAAPEAAALRDRRTIRC